MSTYVARPETGWYPDPVVAGVVRFLDHGVWTSTVIARQQPWGPQQMVPPLLHRPIMPLAHCA